MNGEKFSRSGESKILTRPTLRCEMRDARQGKIANLYKWGINAGIKTTELMAAGIVGENPADEHGIQEPAAVGNLGKIGIALQRIWTNRICCVQRLARGNHIVRPSRQV